MMLLIADVLSPTDLQECQSVLASAIFKDGKDTAGWHAALVKNNEQADSEAPPVRALQLRLKTLLQEVRRDHAKTLLQDPELNISEVAYQLGFSHPPALHRAFKRWFGLSPTEYRDGLRRHPASRFWRS